MLQIGLGARGKMWASIIAARRDVVLSGAVDVNPAARAAFAQTYPDVPLFDHIDAALVATKSDGALIVTSPVGRLAQARLLFEAGLPLLVEKPLALDLQEAAAIVRLAERLKRCLMIALQFRYLPASQKIRELVQADVFGPVGFGQFTYQRNRDGRAPHLNKYPLTMGHPMMLEQSIHHLDLIRYCYGREVVQVMCRQWNPSWSMYAHDANVNCLLTLEGGMEVNYLGTWTGGWDNLQFQWRTDCARGVIVQRQLFDDLATARTSDAELTPVSLPSFRAFYDDSSILLSRFIAHLRNGAPLECSGEDHLRTLALCFAAIESSETGRAVRMEEFDRKVKEISDA